MTDDVNKSKKPPTNQSTKSSDMNGNLISSPLTDILKQEQLTRNKKSKLEEADRAVKKHYAEEIKKGEKLVEETPSLVLSKAVTEKHKYNQSQHDAAHSSVQDRKKIRIHDAATAARRQTSNYFKDSHLTGRIRTMTSDPEISKAAMSQINRSDSDLFNEKTEIKESVHKLKVKATKFIRNPNNFDAKGQLTDDALKKASVLDASLAQLEQRKAINQKTTSNRKILGIDVNSQEIKATKAIQKHDAKRERLGESITESINQDKITTRVQGDLKAKLGIGPDSYKSQNQKFFDAQAKAGAAFEKLADKSKLTAEEIGNLEDSVDRFTKEMNDAGTAVAAHGKKPDKKDTDGGGGGGLSGARAAVTAFGPMLMQAVQAIGTMIKAGVSGDIDAGAIPIAARYKAELESRSIQVSEYALANRKFDMREAAISGDMTALLAIGDTKWGEKGGLQDLLKGQKGADWINKDFNNGEMSRSRTEGVAAGAEHASGEAQNKSKLDAIKKLGGKYIPGVNDKLGSSSDRRSPSVQAPATFSLGDNASNYAKSPSNPDGYDPATYGGSPKKGKPNLAERVIGAVVDNTHAINGTNVDLANMTSQENNRREFNNTTRSASVQTQNLDIDLKMAKSRISGAMLNKTAQFGLGIREANSAIGGKAGEALMREFSEDPGNEGAGLLKSLQYNGISPEQFTAAAAQHGAAQGSVFKSGNIISAKKMENAGRGSMELNLQRQDALAAAGANNPSDGLASIMAMAVETGLNSSASITAMVSHTSKMAETSGAGKYGLDVTKEAAASIARFVDPDAKNKEQAEQAAADAASIINKQNSSVGTSFQDQIGLAQIMQGSGITHKSAVQLKGLQDPIANKLAADLKAIDDEKDSTKKNKLIKAAEDMAFNVIPNAMGTGEVDVNTVEGRKKILTGLDERSKAIKNGPQNLVEGVTEEDIKGATKSGKYTDIEDSRLRGKIGTVAQAAGLTGQQYMNQILGKDVGPGNVGALTAPPDPNSVKANLNTLANAQNEEAAKQAGLAAGAFGGVAKTMEAINVLMKQRLEELNSKNADAVVGAGDNQNRGKGDAFNISDTMKQPLADLALAAEQAAAALRIVVPSTRNVGGTGATTTKLPAGKR